MAWRPAYSGSLDFAQADADLAAALENVGLLESAHVAPHAQVEAWASARMEGIDALGLLDQRVEKLDHLAGHRRRRFVTNKLWPVLLLLFKPSHAPLHSQLSVSPLPRLDDLPADKPDRLEQKSQEQASTPPQL